MHIQTQSSPLPAGPEAVLHTARQQCGLCASDMTLKALSYPRRQRRMSRRRQAPTRASANSLPLAAKATDGITPATVMTAQLQKKPQVLAPAGGWPQLRAAVENGADAVYLGLSDFNARARAVNFSPEELPNVRPARIQPCPYQKYFTVTLG